jgi:YfiH family protein
VTDQAGYACTIMVADCLPLLLTNQQGSAVAAAHAGWRGLAGSNGRGIVDTVLAHFGAIDAARNGSSASEIIAWMGPCIGPLAFEVGDEVREVFVSNDTAAQAMFKSIGSGKWLANLPGLTRLRLNAAGVSQIYGNDGGSQWCTVNNPSRFFSHRRDRVSGRMAACVWIC